jgi:hypothetical protein
VPDVTQRPDGDWRDAQDMLVEDFGNADNLMIDHCLVTSGNPIVRIDAGGRLDDLAGFEACLAIAARLRDRTKAGHVRSPHPHRRNYWATRLRDRTP